MSDGSKIEWTEASWNPVTGCDKVSPGCDHCYAETFAERWRGVPGHHFEQGFDVVLRPERLDQPLRWRRPRRVFVNSMSDLFHDAVPDEYIARVFAVMARAPQHTFQLLTKRHARMRSLVGDDGARLLEATADEETAQALYAQWPLPNVWLGVSVENQQWADIRIPALLETPAAVRWLSCEPLLGPIDLTRIAAPRAQQPEMVYDVLTPRYGVPDRWQAPMSRGIGWCVVGGESGPRARPMHPDWARGLRDHCTSASVPFFFKQWGSWEPLAPVDARPGDSLVADDGAVHVIPADRFDSFPQEFRWRSYAMRRVSKKAAGRLLDGRTWDEYPTSDPVVSR